MNTNRFSPVLRHFVMALAVPALLVMVVRGANAQQPDRQARMAEHAEHIVSGLTHELNLTDSQTDLFEKSLASGPQPGALRRAGPPGTSAS